MICSKIYKIWMNVEMCEMCRPDTYAHLRIWGDSDFVKTVLKSGEEKLERKYMLKAQDYDFERVVRRVAEVLSLKVDDILSLGKSAKTIKGRSLLGE